MLRIHRDSQMKGSVWWVGFPVAEVTEHGDPADRRGEKAASTKIYK